MLNVQDTKTGIPWDRRTPYEQWVEDELKLELHRGFAAGPLGRMPVGPWRERNLSATFFDFTGAESLAGMYVGEIAPGQSTTPAHQIYDEVIFIVAGHGSTTVQTPARTYSFEWGPQSLFAIPLNATYRLYNGSGREPARFISVNTLPVMMNLFRDKRFIFDTAHDFKRIDDTADPTDAVLYKPDAAHDRTAVDLYDTNFVPDVLAVPRVSFAERGHGNKTAYFELCNSALSCHMAEHPGLQFYNPHRHGPSGFVFTIKGKGYSLMWLEGGEMERFDWPEDDIGVIVPPTMWWHGHWGTDPLSLQLAVKLMSRKHPVSHSYDGVHKHISKGGTILHYTDLDKGLRDNVWKIFEQECRKNGYDVKAPDRQVA
jgi:mannose-6-phosphate isomerase-like protein (cupin superfamily)